jgi:outer membrane autotransporter protein
MSLKPCHKTPAPAARLALAPAALLLLAALLPPPLPAAVTEATGTTISIDAGSDATRTAVTYHNAGATGIRPIYVSGSGSFTGTTITVTATAASGNGRNAVTVETGGAVSLTDSAITATLYGVTLGGTSAITLDTTTITTRAASGHGLTLATSSTATLTGGTIATAGRSAYGLNLATSSAATLNDVNIVTEGITAHGIFASGARALTMNGGTITTSGSGAFGIRVNNVPAPPYATSLDNVRIIARGENSIGLMVRYSSQAMVNGLDIRLENGGDGINMQAWEKNDLLPPRLDIKDSTIHISGTGGAGIFMWGSFAILYGDNLNITTDSGRNFGVFQQQASTVNLINSTIHTSGSGAMGYFVHNTDVGGYWLTGQPSLTDVNLQNVNIITDGADASGFYFTWGNLANFGDPVRKEHGIINITVSGVTITTTGPRSHGIVSANNENAANLFDHVTVNVLGDDSYGVLANGGGTVALQNSTVSALGANGVAPVADTDLMTPAGFVSDTSAVVVRAGIHGAGVTAVSARSDAARIAAGGTIALGNSSLGAARHAVAILASAGAPAGVNTFVLTGGTLTAGADLCNVGDAAADIRLAGVTGGGGNALAVSGSAVVTFSATATSLTGGLAVSGASETTVALAGSALAGNLASGGNAALTVTLDNSKITGASTLSGAAALSVNVGAQSVWDMTADSTLTALALTGGARVRFPDPAKNAGAYAILTTATLSGAGGFALHTDIAAVRGDRLNVTGEAAGAHSIQITNTNAAAVTGLEPPLLLVETAGGAATFSGTTAAGLYQYIVQNGAQIDADGAPGLAATNWYLHRAGLSATADAIINTAAMLGRDWHHSLDALHLRMGDVRAEWFRGPERGLERGTGVPPVGLGQSVGKAGDHGRDARAPLQSGNLWLRARGYRLNAGSRLTGRSFDEYVYGLTAGGDKAFRNDERRRTVLLGAFLDLGRIERDFAGAGDTGATNSLSAGLYGTWLHDTGWHADLVLKADRYKHHFESLTAGARPVRGAHYGAAQGVSLELGRRVQRADGWWVEPAAQAAVAWLRGANYRTAPGNQALDVRISTARTAHHRALVRFGKHLRDSRWTPYGKFGVVKTATAAGAIRVAGETFAPGCDGWRVEFGAGAGCRLDAKSQLYLDYEYAKAARYERPWSLNLGYRALW